MGNLAGGLPDIQRRAGILILDAKGRAEGCALCDSARVEVEKR
jgi:hypothetical protein